jgi:hypothetical protein
MKKHIQTLNVKDHGDASNCYQTTLACILNVEIWQVPNFALFYDDPSWPTIINNWLSINHKVKEVQSSSLILYHQGFMKKFPKEFKNIPYMVSDDSPRGPYRHVVIYKNGKMIHDSYPGGMGIILTKNVECTYLKPNKKI